MKKTGPNMQVITVLIIELSTLSTFKKKKKMFGPGLHKVGPP